MNRFHVDSFHLIGSIYIQFPQNLLKPKICIEVLVDFAIDTDSKLIYFLINHQFIRPPEISTKSDNNIIGKYLTDPFNMLSI